MTPSRRTGVIRARTGLLAICAVQVLAAAACGTLAPQGLPEERDRLEASGRPFSVPLEARALPPLDESASLDDVLARAFASNAELEATYFAWAAAIERVPQASALPDLAFGFEYLFSDERMRRWDRTTLGASQMVPYPGKLRRAGRIALDEAIAARHRLEDQKFSLQADVVGAWSALWLTDRSVEIEEQNLVLLRQLAAVARERVAVGRAAQADASKADLEVASARNELEARRAQRSAALADVNALLSRAVEVPLRPLGPPPPTSLPPDAEILSLAAERNPELAALAAEARARGNAVELARLAYVPDLALGVEVRGSMERMLMGMLTLPLQLPRIRAGIAEATASQRMAQAALRARQDQLGARVALGLFLARDSERQLALFREVLLPRARDVVTATATSYATGGSSFLDLIDSQRALLQLALAEAELQATHGTSVAALEALCALDFGALTPATRVAP